jgi:hypothetical protein
MTTLLAFAALLTAVAVPIEDLSEFVGHTSINVTIKRYRHLCPKAWRNAALALDAFLERADTAARLAQVEVGQSATAAAARRGSSGRRRSRPGGSACSRRASAPAAAATTSM